MTTNFDPNIHLAIRRMELIFATNVLRIPNKAPLQESAFIEVVIRLNEVLHKAKSIGSRISFADDLRLFPPYISDITDVVRECRDAVCHIKADGHYVAPDGSPKQSGRRGRHVSRLKRGETYAQVTFNVAFGKGVLAQIDSYTLESGYNDDVCFFYGAHRLYLKRHIERAVNEAKTALHSYLSP